MAGPRTNQKPPRVLIGEKVRKVKGRVFEHRAEPIGSCHVSHLRAHEEISKESPPK
ncbi:hypothetical protein KI387_034592, partial [Taxus chinensis]